MRLIDANPGCTITHHEDEFFIYGTVNVAGEAFEFRIPIGDGAYHARIVFERIILPKLGKPQADISDTDVNG